MEKEDALPVAPTGKEQHEMILEELCRICGKPCITHENEGSKKKILPHPEIYPLIKTKYAVDLSTDQKSRHPPFICYNCFWKLLYEKQCSKETQVQLASWPEHTGSCGICLQYKIQCKRRESSDPQGHTPVKRKKTQHDVNQPSDQSKESGTEETPKTPTVLTPHAVVSQFSVSRSNAAKTNKTHLFRNVSLAKGRTQSVGVVVSRSKQTQGDPEQTENDYFVIPTSSKQDSTDNAKVKRKGKLSFLSPSVSVSQETSPVVTTSPQSSSNQSSPSSSDEVIELPTSGSLSNKMMEIAALVRNSTTELTTPTPSNTTLLTPHRTVHLATKTPTPSTCNTTLLTTPQVNAQLTTPTPSNTRLLTTPHGTVQLTTPDPSNTMLLTTPHGTAKLTTPTPRNTTLLTTPQVKAQLTTPTPQNTTLLTTPHGTVQLTTPTPKNTTLSTTPHQTAQVTTPTPRNTTLLTAVDHSSLNSPGDHLYSTANLTTPTPSETKQSTTRTPKKNKRSTTPQVTAKLTRHTPRNTTELTAPTRSTIVQLNAPITGKPFTFQLNPTASDKMIKEPHNVLIRWVVPPAGKDSTKSSSTPAANKSTPAPIKKTIQMNPFATNRPSNKRSKQSSTPTPNDTNQEVQTEIPDEFLKLILQRSLLTPLSEKMEKIATHLFQTKLKQSGGVTADFQTGGESLKALLVPEKHKVSTRKALRTTVERQRKFIRQVRRIIGEFEERSSPLCQTCFKKDQLINKYRIALCEEKKRRKRERHLNSLLAVGDAQPAEATSQGSTIPTSNSPGPASSNNPATDTETNNTSSRRKRPTCSYVTTRSYKTRDPLHSGQGPIS